MKNKIISWSLFLFWISVIFYFSNQTGTESTIVSNGVIASLENIFNIPLNSAHNIFLLRKLAHFSEYAILGALTLNLYYAYQKKDIKYVFYSILFCLIYACSDEFHQGFIGGRSPQVFDVFIDTTGSLVGSICYKLLFKKNK